MLALALIVVIGLLGGIAIGVQAPLASAIGQRLGILESIFIIHLGGLVAVGLPLLLRGGGALGQWRSVPPLPLLAGALGVAVIGATVYNVPRIGVAAAITLIITGQLCTGVVIDHFGAFGVVAKSFSVDRMIGLAFVAFGVWWTLRH
jgi:bacterial/archaeal transporter family-2 protein